MQGSSVAHRTTSLLIQAPAVVRAGAAMATVLKTGGLGTTIMTTTMTMPPGAGVD